jgi:protein-disulfide isomerase
MDKRFMGIIGVLIAVFLGIIFFNNHNKTTPAGGATNHVTGNKDSTVTLVEYGDFQCSACGSFYPVTKQIQEKYADKIRFQFRNLPLTQPHPNAFAGARAAEAADMQGKFWQMHDILYQNQDPYGQSGWVASSDPLNKYFVTYAKQLNLDISKFKTDFGSVAVNNRINADIEAFKATGEQMSTPSYFINGKKIDNSSMLDAKGQPNFMAFSKVIDAALAKNK